MEKDERKTISLYFKYALSRCNFTYEQFAERIGLSSKQALSYVLNNRKNDAWKYSDIRRYCDVLEISLDRFFSEND